MSNYRMMNPLVGFQWRWSRMIGFYSINKGLIDGGLAKKIVGYKLTEDVEKLKIYDTDVEGDEVYVWLV